ncbi:TerC family protein [Flaviflagellibacter deserti]|uniref:TerC family protein n=1 Tax=Flaviflagellibacter deserti TaxID=2267266 RepID=A0ABV9Z6I8_9HYPH
MEMFSAHAFAEVFSAEGMSALLQVIMIDLVLAGDNAIVIGLAAAGLPLEQRGKVILVGIGAATALRIIFALMTTQLLQVVGLLLAGGLLLLWVSWKMWRELRTPHHHEVAAVDDLGNVQVNADGTIAASVSATAAPTKTFRQAVTQIIVADVSMSLDNVLAVAGAAREHPIILVFGLALSIALMGFAATLVANILQKHRWIAYVGLAVILYVALDMMYRGALEVLPYLS